MALVLRDWSRILVRNHDEKIKDMSRSVLPSSWRVGARETRRAINQRHRARVRGALAAARGATPEINDMYRAEIAEMVSTAVLRRHLETMERLDIEYDFLPRESEILHLNFWALAFEQLKDFYAHHLGYAVEMSNRPQTLYALMDSPVGLAAWILDHDKDSYEMIAPAFAGKPGGLSRDDVLDNITMYWLTGTAISSARLYWENKLDFFDVKGITVPTGVSAFPHELYCAPRSWSEKAYPKLVYYKQHDVGGHFAAWEQPQLFCEDIRATFRSVRTV